MKKYLFVLLALSMSGSLTFAQDAKKSTKNEHVLSKEEREKMAAVHEKAAACLRSEKSLLDCHDEMMVSCEQNMGEMGCPMMGGKGMMMHHRGMKHHKEDKSKKEK